MPATCVKRCRRGVKPLMTRHTLTALGLKAKLAEEIKVAAANGSTRRIADGDGLMLVVRANGAAAWVWRYPRNGKRTDLTIGRWPTVPLQMAREKTEEHRRSIFAGVDPSLARKEVRVARQVTESDDKVRALFNDWITSQKAGLSQVYRDNIEAAFLKDVFPALGSMAPQDVSRADCLKILREIEERGALVMVRRVRLWLRQMFEYGIDDEARPALKLSPVPMGTLKSFKKSKARHFPAVTDVHQIPALMASIRKTPNWINRTALLLSAYLFQRPTEIRQAVWSEFDLDAGKWVIPAERMKGNLEHWVPLAPTVVQLLRQHQGVVGTAGFLFPGRKYEKSISEGTLTGRLQVMGYDGKHTPHGFRAMARTTLDEHLKVDVRFIEKQLSHEIDDRLRGAYNRAEYWDDRAVMMKQWAGWLAAQ